VNKEKIRARQRARQLALQALYQWWIAKHTMIEVEAQFRSINKMDKVDDAYFSQLIHGVDKHLKQIEENFEPFLDRGLHELNPVEHAVLRLSTYELIYCPETPYRIILEESVLLAKTYGSQDGFRFVNGVLNKLARKVRSVEIQHQNE
jgi:transcription antitermination protein NusB